MINTHAERKTYIIASYRTRTLYSQRIWTSRSDIENTLAQPNMHNHIHVTSTEVRPLIKCNILLILEENTCGFNRLLTLTKPTMLKKTWRDHHQSIFLENFSKRALPIYIYLSWKRTNTSFTMYQTHRSQTQALPLEWLTSTFWRYVLKLFSNTK